MVILSDFILANEVRLSAISSGGRVLTLATQVTFVYGAALPGP